MNKIEMEAHKTYNLIKKKKYNPSSRMPSIKKIHEMLDFFKIEHSFEPIQNWDTKNRKEGFIIHKIGNYVIDMDTSDNLYSSYSHEYTKTIIHIMNEQGIFPVMAHGC